MSVSSSFYADHDIVLLTSLLTKLQLMCKLCDSEMYYLDLEFNPYFQVSRTADW